MIKAGTILNGPDGIGYKLTADVVFGDSLHAGLFEPINGTPKSKPGKEIPYWVFQELDRHQKEGQGNGDG